uniref:Uncharacterized protein n=1 Tax=Sphaeramia orbicularis TaxID=375764 RepID=A0A672ZB13_9TELE
MSSCLDRCDAVKNTLSQSLHWNDFSPVCVRWWTLRLSESFPTLLTAKQFLSSVSMLVALEIRCSKEFFPTLLTAVWFLSGVESLVLSICTDYFKFFTTQFTSIWCLSCVGTFVDLKASSPGE